MLKKGYKIIDRVLGRSRKVNLFSGLDPQIEYRPENQQPIFVTGPGRSGTHFIAKLFELLPDVKAFHLDDVGDSVGDSFEVFRKWNSLEIGSNGFLNSRGFLIQQAAGQHQRFLESNPLVAFSLKDLHDRFGGKIVISVRHPKKVVESHFRKGWYAKVSPFDTGYSGYQYFHDRPNHFFSRITPKDKMERAMWQEYPRLGKIAWMWRATYEEIAKQLKALPPSSYRFVQLENLDHGSMESLCGFLGLEQKISEKQFLELIKTPPGKGDDRAINWDESSRNVFDNEIKKAITLLPPEIQVDNWLFER